MAMYDFLGGIAEKWVWFTCFTESRIVNFSNMTTSGCQSPDVRSPQCLTSGGLKSMLLSLGCFPTGISDSHQNRRVYNGEK